MNDKKPNRGKKKIIELPELTIEGLKDLAEKERMTTKPYMEKILIAHEKTNRIKPTNLNNA